MSRRAAHGLHMAPAAVRVSGIPARPQRAQAGGVSAADPRAISSPASRPATGGAPWRSMSRSAVSAAARSRNTAGLVATASTAAAISLAGSDPSAVITYWINASRRQAAHGRRGHGSR